MTNSEQALQDWVGESPASTSFGVDTAVVPALTADEGGETPSSEFDGHLTSSNINYEISSISPQYLLDCLYNTKGPQKQDDPPLQYIDPKLLWVSRPADKTPIGTPHTFTLDTQPDLETSPPPTSAPAAHRDDDHSAVTPADGETPDASTFDTQPDLGRSPPSTSACRDDDHSAVTPANPQPPFISETPAQRHKKRRAESLENLTTQRHYHDLPTDDREYFDRVVANLTKASYLRSPQSREPTVGNAVGRLLIKPHRSTGVGAASENESVYVVLVDRPEEGAFVCWISGETRADRRLIRTLDHVRGHFNHRPYHCSRTHFDQQTGSTSSLPSTSVCGQSFTSKEALKDHQTKMKNKSHSCDKCIKTYTNSGNLKRHMKKEHPS